MSKDSFGKGNKDNSKRKFSGGGPRPDHASDKREQAIERDKAWSRLTPQQQLDALDRRLGKDLGAARQRARLTALIEKRKHQPKAEAKGAEPVGQMLAKEDASGAVKAKERRAAEQAKRPGK